MPGIIAEPRATLVAVRRLGAWSARRVFCGRRKRPGVRRVRPVSRGDTGKEVVDIQTRLRALGFFLGQEGADGCFGPKTELAIREFQQRRLLVADGIVGPNTWTELVEAGYEPGDRLLYLRVPYMRGDDVLYVQRHLAELGFDCGPVNGIFGPALEEAVTDFQRNAGLNVDGIVGETTLAHLRRLQKAHVEGQPPRKIPDRLNGYVGKDSIVGLRVSIDAGHGGTDGGGVSCRGLLEKDVNLTLALTLSELLSERGAEVFLVRTDDVEIDPYERADRANAWELDVHLCLHHNHTSSRKARGAATYYFANSAYYSECGKRLAGYMVDALTRELGRADLHKHGRNYACLRELKSLSVMVEPAFITHPDEGHKLEDPRELEREAQALVAGLEAYLARR